MSCAAVLFADGVGEYCGSQYHCEYDREAAHYAGSAGSQVDVVTQMKHYAVAATGLFGKGPVAGAKNYTIAVAYAKRQFAIWPPGYKLHQAQAKYEQECNSYKTNARDHCPANVLASDCSTLGVRAFLVGLIL